MGVPKKLRMVYFMENPSLKLHDFFGVPQLLGKPPYDQVDIMGVKGIDSGRPAGDKFLLG